MTSSNGQLRTGHGEGVPPGTGEELVPAECGVTGPRWDRPAQSNQDGVVLSGTRWQRT